MIDQIDKLLANKDHPNTMADITRTEPSDRLTAPTTVGTIPGPASRAYR
jgi:hypothetical protein